MSKKWWFPVILAIVLTSLLSACGGGTNKGSDSSASPSEQVASTEAAPSTSQSEEPQELEGTLEFWSFDKDNSEKFANKFMELHPKVKINVTIPGWNELMDNMVNTIAAGSGAPDVAYVTGGTTSRLVNGDGLEDMLQFGAMDYKNDFAESNWNHWLSMDGKKLIGVPWDNVPTVTWYRPDLLEKAGYPSDPNELAQVMADPDKLIEIGQSLKAQGVYLFENDKTPLDIVTGGIGFFDRNLKYLRNTDEFAKYLDMSKRVKQLGLAMNTCAMWCDDGKALTINGKVAMLFYGTWYGDGLGKLDDSGSMNDKWRMTALPFGKYINGSGSAFVIPSQSKNKELAWKFTQWALLTKEGQEVTTIVPGFKPAWENQSFKDLRYAATGDQQVSEVISELMGKATDYTVETPFAAKAQQIWDDGIKNALEKNIDSKAALQQIEDDTMKALKPEIDKLKAQVGIQ